MVLKENEILNILKESQKLPKWVEQARSYNRDLEALINGVEYTDLLIRVEHKEDDKKNLARRKYVKNFIFL